MKICMMSELFYPYAKGGAERRFMEISKRLAEKHDVTVYSLRLKGQIHKETWNGVNILRVGFPHSMERRSIPQLLTYVSPLVRCAQRKYDIVHVNQGISSLGAIFRRKNIVATFHDLYGHAWNDYYNFPLSTAGLFIEKLWSKLKYNKIIANSLQTKNKLLDAGFDNIETIISGIDVDFIKDIKMRKEKTVIYVGRLEQYKHLDVLLEAVRNSDWKLKIIGQGSDIARLKKIAGDNAEFLGYVSERRKIEEMKKASVLVNPSAIEGLGLVVLEAMACGTVPIMRNLNCYKEFANCKNSFMLDSMDSLADTIEKAMKSKKMFAGIKTAENFSWDKTAEKVESVYRGVLNKQIPLN